MTEHDDAPTVIRLPLIPGPNELADTLERRRRVEDQLEQQRRQAVQTVAETAEAVGKAGTQLDQAVAHARAAGASWRDIGDACNLSRQAAQQRWGDR